MREKNRRLQEHLGQSMFQIEIHESKIQKIIEDTDQLLVVFKGLGLENKKLKDELKGKIRFLSKKVKFSEECKKEIEELQKEMEFWKRQSHKSEGKVIEVGKKYLAVTGKQL